MSKEYTLEDILLEIREQFCQDTVLDSYHTFLFSKIADLTNRLRKLEAKDDNSISIPKTALKNGVLNTDE